MKRFLLNLFPHSLGPGVVTAVMVALSFCNVAFCGEIHDAAK